MWDTATGQRLHTLRDKSESMMAIQDLAVDPYESSDTEVVIVSSSSDPSIRRWRISLQAATQIVDFADTNSSKDKLRNIILEHETSVYKVYFSGNEEDSDLWTASADGTAKCLSRARDWETEDTYVHGDYVRAIAVTANWVLTAGRNEDVKIWDRATGKLWHTYDGHYEDVTGLVVLPNENQVISVSIDGTVRIWDLGRKEIELARKEEGEKDNGFVKEKEEFKKSLLTAEEEAELAELMDSDAD